MVFLGVDPGISGALAALDSETREVRFFDTPVLEVVVNKKKKHVQDASAISLMLQNLSANQEIMVGIEKVQAMPGSDGHGGRQAMGATSAFNFGMGFGMWLGILAALQIPHQQVHPATWKAALMRDMDKDKDASRIKAMQLDPRAGKDLTLKKHHGRADALLIATYVEKQYGFRPAAVMPETAMRTSLFE